MSISRTFTMTDATLIKVYLAAVAARAENKDPAMAPTLDAIVTWCGTVVPLWPHAQARLGDAVVADMLEGISFPDDGRLDAIRTAYLAYLRRPRTEPVPPTPSPGPLPPQRGPETADILAAARPWIPGSLSRIDPGWVDWLKGWAAGGPGTVILGNLDLLPDQMRRAGFSGRDNALYYTVSRSYAGWNWGGDPNDPDAHLSDQRQELHDWWGNYLSAVASVLGGQPNVAIIMVANDGHDRCGRMLAEYGRGQLTEAGITAERIELGTSEPMLREESA